MRAGPFSIGSTLWPGVSKLIEEAGEVVQVCGKLIGSGGDANHWDGTNLRERLEDEIADLMAACVFVMAACKLDEAKVQARMNAKVAKFAQWHKEQS